MFQGLRTVIYAVTDADKAKDWYSKVLSQAPYFSEPFYVGFNVGGFELGLDPDTSNGKLLVYIHGGGSIPSERR